MKSRAIVIIGAGGHAQNLIEAIKTSGERMAGIVDMRPESHGKTLMGVPIIGDDTTVFTYLPQEILLVNGVGSIGTPNHRREIFERFKKKGYTFYNTVHYTSYISPSSACKEGLQLMAGAIIQARCSIGDNVIINTGAIVDHGCILGSHVHIAPGAVLSGGVTVGSSTHIGAGAVIIQGVTIGKNCIIGAGSVVLKDVPDNITAVGTPARDVQQRKKE